MREVKEATGISTAGSGARIGWVMGAHRWMRGKGPERIGSCLGWQWRHVGQCLCLPPLPTQCLAQGLKEGSLEQRKDPCEAGAGGSRCRSLEAGMSPLLERKMAGTWGSPASSLPQVFLRGINETLINNPSPMMVIVRVVSNWREFK